MINSKPLTAKVYEAVYSDIINGSIKPGDIITEGLLIKQFGVSKSPVREALIALCNEDILRSIPRLGYMVVPITPRKSGARSPFGVGTVYAGKLRVLTTEVLDGLEDMVRKTGGSADKALSYG